MTAQADDKREQEEREAKRPKLDKETLKDLDPGPAGDQVAGGGIRSDWVNTQYERC